MNQMKDYYNHVDQKQKYCIGNEKSKKRIEELQSLYERDKRFFKGKVLDLASGGGILSYVLQEKHSYVGIDVNEEMIQRARKTMSNTNSKFLVGDITKKKIFKELETTFDTLTFLGNSFCHFSTNQFLDLLRGIETVVHQDTNFILEYRNVVKMLYNNEWKEELTIKRGKKRS